ncbi:MAG: sigma-70 family RNA polymerase sigma factor [Planctomycetaceae bacterium]|nr:sigma-70 family RNA polymerase sigma factor [Planctomycetaceae bacterium]
MNDDPTTAAERVTILLAQQGDRSAFARLIDTYDRRLLYFIRRMLGDSDGALDILQTVWLIVLKKLPRLKSPAAFRVWLYRITHDQVVSFLRRKSRWPQSLADPPVPDDSDSTDSTDATIENVELIHRALQDLSVPHRQVLTLQFLEDLTIDETAAILDCNPGTVKSRLHYGKQALRRRIKELLHE